MILMISGVFSNVRQVTYSNTSIKLSISNEEYPIGESDSSLKIFVEPPLTKEKFNNLFFSQTGIVTGQETELRFSFQLNNDIQENSLIIFTLPPEFLLYRGDSLKCQAICFEANAFVPCDAEVSTESK